VKIARRIQKHPDQTVVWMIRGCRRIFDSCARRRSNKPSPCRVFLPFSAETERKTRRVCPGMCPNTCAQNEWQATIQSPLVVAFSVKGDGLDGGRLHPFAFEWFRVSVAVTYTCRCAVRWPSGRRRRFAKASGDSRMGLKSMISGPFLLERWLALARE
jgi:hypothetical protein